MTIPTQVSLAGFIASTPQLNFTGSGVARFYARVGVEHARKEPDGSFTQLDPTFHDLVLYRTSAERAYARFRKGDSFVAHGYIHEYEMEKNGQSVASEEFVARRIHVAGGALTSPGASPRGAVYGDTSGHARDTQS